MLKGSFYVMLGAVSYGLLATIVKLCYSKDFSTTEVIVSQFVVGFLILIVLLFMGKNNQLKMSLKSKKMLMIYGTTMGFTSIFYYLSVHYLNASVAVVMLMQSVWMGIVYEAIALRKFPNILKIFALIFIALGTLLATRIFEVYQEVDFSFVGYVFGILSAVSYMITLIGANRVAKEHSPVQRGLYMIVGGGVVVLLFALFAQFLPYYGTIELLPQSLISAKAFELSIFWTYGIPLALFGTVLPPILMNKGFPIVGVGLGSILSAMELPVAILFASIMLGELVYWEQWFGVLLILISITLIHWKEVVRKHF